MSQSKLTNLAQKISQLSANSKVTLLVVLGALLFLIHSSFSKSSDNLWLNILFLGGFSIILYLGAFLQKKHLHNTNTQVSQAISENTLADYAQKLTNSEVNATLHLLCEQASLAQQKTASQEQEVKELTEVSEHLGICMEIINDAIQEEFGQIEQLATAMNQMTATVKEVASNAGSASASTTEASDVAQEGSQFVDATIKTINSLSTNIGASADAVNNVELKVEGIGSVVDTIRSISEQTNLLALNAAIEAARAGEAGRGFAVVADEVRNLAKRTQDATVEIQGMIEQLQKSAQEAVSLMGKSVNEADIGVDQVTQAGTKLAGIVEKVAHISDMNYQIASAAEEQTTVAADINENLELVKEVVEGSVTVLQEVTEMAETISGHAKALA
ncbi:methyl-accepting chemotaxis protein [Psychromonas sp. Urea-02u-13]|uniref:methyl-accepting chemotaxis protein n=1 Tax=Psychromonas sp. Urea-02u-13 TaxID=2058326 RepID=UPI001E63F523|nr:methyl-accepting chemotaxis protein [Psychromonas sp. Urea-02u-13]